MPSRGAKCSTGRPPCHCVTPTRSGPRRWSAGRAQRLADLVAGGMGAPPLMVSPGDPRRPDAAAWALRSRRTGVGWAAVVAQDRLGRWQPVRHHRTGELTGSTYRAANAASIIADLIAVAIALLQPFSRRLPGWLVLGPMWLATGLLGVILALAPVAAPFAIGSSTGGLAGWVYVLVYGSFIIQGAALLRLFGLYAAGR